MDTYEIKHSAADGALPVQLATKATASARLKNMRRVLPMRAGRISATSRPRRPPVQGRGPIQLTGRANYRAFTAWLRKELPGNVPDFEARPELLLDEDWVAWSAIYFWTTRRLNEAADRDDVIAVTCIINGGRNGLADRKEKLARAKAAVARQVAAATTTPFSKDWPVLHRGMFDNPDVERLQSLLIHHGAPSALMAISGQPPN